MKNYYIYTAIRNGYKPPLGFKIVTEETYSGWAVKLYIKSPKKRSWFKNIFDPRYLEVASFSTVSDRINYLTDNLEHQAIFFNIFKDMQDQGKRYRAVESQKELVEKEKFESIVADSLREFSDALTK